ncbi:MULTISPECIES: DUF1398 family protein [Nitrospirillum]|uniref:DUF1398 domain-containing protein n=2 Tax=Nitrospirillum TaxID=1543705 RepID=A0A248JWW3_9PROT|nr:DUF1398 family protein [Nitrospirillum amazonense]ASG23203.1 DUF1398 domain-containing protein [Nitrospirillum amazonense CBAmc]MEC4589525.1 DUF1398 family protein [Nitrospirillum amazonense]TWB27662.1 uncharacterized protein YbcV (DUF1398 family) [Nitrospirillum amazonense]TWB38959.1 uncharacterized protein YbcV (DUF1398 family) [Nitrospirillum amazonense]
MNAQRIAIAQRCFAAAYDKSMDFPDIVALLIQSGFEGYTVDYRRNTATYFLPDGDSVALEGHPTDDQVAARFDAAAVASLIKWAQACPSDYSYTAFCRRAKAAGCAGYIVSFSGRRVLYFGRTAETHVEHFPQ